MNFSLEITMKTDLSTLPKVKDIYITMLPGDNFKDVANKGCELVKSGFNQKRKLLRNALKTFTFEKNNEVTALLLKRAEQLSVDQFIKLTQNVQKI